jgi:hypothetical protein
MTNLHLCRTPPAQVGGVGPLSDAGVPPSLEVLSSAIAKLGVSNRYEAALEARQRSWI